MPNLFVRGERRSERFLKIGVRCLSIIHPENLNGKRLHFFGSSLKKPQSGKQQVGSFGTLSA